MTTTFVSSEVTSTGLTVTSGNQVFVSTGGNIVNTTVSSGGTVSDYAGSATSTTILNGGIERVASGGTATRSVVSSGGSLSIQAGTSISATVSSGGNEFLTSTGVAQNTTVLNGGNLGDGGSAIGTVVSSGGGLLVNSGGVASSTTVLSGGLVTVSAGGTSIGDTINGGVLAYSGVGSGDYAATGAGGGLIVNSGGLVENLTISGGQITALISSGGVISGGVLQGGNFEVNHGAIVNGMVVNGATSLLSINGSASNITVSSGTLHVFQQGVISGVVIDAGGVELANTGGTASATTINSGGLLNVSSGGHASGVSIKSGGAMTVASGGSNNGTTVSAGGLETYNLDAGIVGLHVLSGGMVQYDGLAYAAGATTVIDSGTDILTVTEGGTSFRLQLAGSYTGQSFAISKASDGNTLMTLVCFLANTMIATPSGERAVQDLCAGDAVTVVEHGKNMSRPVTWVGSRAVRAGELGDSTEAFPVRIRQHAFADNIPHRDLLVTPEHCILTQAGLTPARMLVNDTTIIVDRSVADYEFFHVELEHHGILLAEGLTTESYLDTGNRGLFVDAGAVVTVSDDVVLAAPLAVSRELVEPVWTQLVERACTLGFETSDRSVALTDQPDLRLLLDTGRELSACWHNEQRYMFRIPGGATPLRLLSRTGVPAETVGPFVDDRRTLGVAVDKLVLWTGLDGTVLPAAEMALNGWYGDEGDRRWTNGDAQLDLPKAGIETFLDVHVVGTTLYRQDATLTT